MSGPDLRRAAAEVAVGLVTPGMRLGIGTGSTANVFVELLGARVRDGLDVVGVPTSEATRVAAEAAGIRLATLDALPELDLTIDGADEIDGMLLAVKGAGGAMLREKAVAAASARMVVIADGSKRVNRIGAAKLPVEVLPFARAFVWAQLGALFDRVEERAADDGAYRTDNGNLIADCHGWRGADPDALARRLQAIPGVVGHGLFLEEVDAAYLASEGVVTRLERDGASG